jgi:hypothetical protein
MRQIFVAEATADKFDTHAWYLYPRRLVAIEAVKAYLIDFAPCDLCLPAPCWDSAGIGGGGRHDCDDASIH